MKTNLRHIFIMVTMAVLCAQVALAFNPFAASVINTSLIPGSDPQYCPAPGGAVKYWYFTTASYALGEPNGGGTLTPNNDSVVSLGGFGGSLVLAFDHNVMDDPANPMGLDAIVFSNSCYSLGTPQVHWAEFATIEIMPELNGNNIPGDAAGEKWYLIPGSHLHDKSTFKTKTWNYRDPGFPIFDYWPESYVTSGYELFPFYETISTQIAMLANPNMLDTDPSNDEVEGYWGYAEYTPTMMRGDRDCDDDVYGIGDDPLMPANIFYTNPDDPMRVGITKGSSGGDAFDINWAVDPATWQKVNLSSFRYIRLTTAVDAVFPSIGEISAEIDAVSDVRGVTDITGDGKSDYLDVQAFCAAWMSQWPQSQFNPAADINVDNKIDWADYCLFAKYWN